MLQSVKKLPSVTASIGGDQIRHDRRIRSPGVSPALGILKYDLK